MHRSYQPSKPTANKVLAKRWDEMKFSSHRDRVRVAKPMVDTKPPKVHSHMAVKMKKLQLEEERNAVIDRDNRMLLEKMSTIMHTRGRIDDRNDYEHKSLNRLKRQREMMQTMDENQRIMERLKDRTRKPNYDNAKMAVDWERKRQYASTITAYPPDWYQRMEQEGKVRSHGRRESAMAKSAPDTLSRREPLPPIGRGSGVASGYSDAASRAYSEDESDDAAADYRGDAASPANVAKTSSSSYGATTSSALVSSDVKTEYGADETTAYTVTDTVTDTVTSQPSS